MTDISVETAVPTSNFAPIPAIDEGSYPAWVSGIYLIGTQEQRPFEGKEKLPCKEIMISVELAGITWETEGTDEYPSEIRARVLSRTMPFIFSDRANFSKTLRALDPDGSKTNQYKSLSALLGLPCQATVIKKERADKQGFNNYMQAITSPAVLPGWVQPVATVEPTLFNFYADTFETYLDMPKWVQKKCTEASDFPGSKLEKYISESQTVSQEEPTEATAGGHSV